MSQVMNYGVKPSVGRRVNFRMLSIIAVFAVLVGYPVYTFVKAQLNGGVERVGNSFNVDLKAMGFFNLDPAKGSQNDVPPQFRQLDGKQVALEGFMWNGNSSADRVNSFEFVYNVTKCCFNGPPKVQERIYARVPNHAAIDYDGAEVRLVGTLHVDVQHDPSGNISSVYTMDVNHVEPM